MITTNQKYYDFHNGINFITFGLIELDVDNEKVIVGISDLGKIIVTDYPLFEDKNGNLQYSQDAGYKSMPAGFESYLINAAEFKLDDNNYLAYRFKYGNEEYTDKGQKVCKYDNDNKDFTDDVQL